MSKIIKHHIRRSLPLFIIFSLIISSTVFGLVFNFDFNFYKLADTTRSEAQAADSTAPTAVEVRNASPDYVINGEPKEVPASTSTSPVNVGDAIGFAATAEDPESNHYYLLICPTAGTASTSGGVPECPGGPGTEFCVSGITDSGVEATCAYSVADPPAETDDWYAFVCDDHSVDQAECSETASQGAGPNNYASSSPFYINHAPAFTGLITAGNYKDPGGTFTFRATTSDADLLGGADGVYLYVCSSNSFSTTTGCTAQTWCIGGAATSTNYVECSFATSTALDGWVTPDGTYSYWGFVKDSHSFASAANSRTNTYTVNNVAPTVVNSSIEINDGSNITLGIKDGSPVEVAASGTISDLNGCWEVQSATATLYWSGIGTSSIACAADEDNCYPILSTACVYSGGCGTYPDDTGSYTCTTTLAFHAIPTNNSDGNTNAWSVWMAGLAGFDDQGAYGAATNTLGSAVDVLVSSALDVQEAGINYGQVKGGQDTGMVNSTTTVENYGNSPIDVNMDVSDMNKDATNYIDAVQQEFDLANFDWGFGTWKIATTSSDELVDTVIIKPVTGNLTITDEVLWGIGIPGGTTSGNYAGLNTFYVAVDQSDW